MRSRLNTKPATDADFKSNDETFDAIPKDTVIVPAY